MEAEEYEQFLDEAYGMAFTQPPMAMLPERLAEPLLFPPAGTAERSYMTLESRLVASSTFLPPRPLGSLSGDTFGLFTAISQCRPAALLSVVETDNDYRRPGRPYMVMNRLFVATVSRLELDPETRPGAGYVA